MEATIDSRLVVLENQIETIERELNGLDRKNPKTDLTFVIALQDELEELLYAKINLLIEKNRLKDKELSSIH